MAEELSPPPTNACRWTLYVQIYMAIRASIHTRTHGGEV